MKEEEMREEKKREERVYVQDELWRGGHHLQHRGEDEEARLDARVHQTTSRPLVAQFGHFSVWQTRARISLLKTCKKRKKK